MHCLVTGGAGFIGSHLVDALLERGYLVRVLDNLSTGKQDNLSSTLDQIEFIEGDICDKNFVLKACQGMDSVFHFAASSSVMASVENPLLAHNNNVTGTINVLEGARQSGIQKIIFASSAAVYGSEPTQPKTEAMPADPINPYGLSKSIGEQYCKMYTSLFGIQTICLRFFNVFGPRQNPQSPYSGVISIFTDKAVKNKPVTIYGNGFQTRDFVYVGDVIRANLLALEAQKPGFSVYNVATGKSQNLHNILDNIKLFLGHDILITYLPERQKDIRDSLGDIKKISSELGFNPNTSFQEGLRSYFNEVYRRHTVCG